MKTEISLGDVLALARKGWIGFPIMIILALIIGCGYLAWKKPYYVVEISVAPTETESQSGAQSLLSSYAASFGLGSAEKSPEFSTFLDILNGPAVSYKLAGSRPDLLPEMFPSKWDGQAHQWKRSEPSLIGRVFGKLRWVAPNYQDVSRFLEDNIAEKDSTVSPIARLRIQTADARFGVDLLNALYKSTEEILRANARSDDLKKLDYLRNRLENPDLNLEQRQALIALVSRVERDLMLLSNDLPYAAKIVEPAELPQRPDGPVVWQILLMSLVGGMFAGFVLSIALGLGGWSALRGRFQRMSDHVRAFDRVI